MNNSCLTMSQLNIDSDKRFTNSWFGVYNTIVSACNITSETKLSIINCFPPVFTIWLSSPMR